MNSQDIQKMINDTCIVRSDALNAVNSAGSPQIAYQNKCIADAGNRVAIALTFVAEALLGIQLEGAQVREAMEMAPEMTPDQMAAMFRKPNE